MNLLQQELKSFFPTIFKENVDLSYHSTLRTGGCAKYYFEIDCLENLERVFEWSQKKGIDFLVLGRGSNVVIQDSPLDVFVLNLKKKKTCFEKKDREMTFFAFTPFYEAIRESQKYFLKGMEFATGIPGTIGGGLKMNAGTKQGELKDSLVKAVVFRNGKLETLFKNDLNLSYRSSDLGDRDIIWKATFLLSQVNEEEMMFLKKESQSYLEYRKQTQPLNKPSGGSTFKNPKGFKAATLIEQAGLKGKKIGGMMISEKHPNFIVNHHRGTAQDTWHLIDFVQEAVDKKFNILLKAELISFGNKGT